MMILQNLLMHGGSLQSLLNYLSDYLESLKYEDSDMYSGFDSGPDARPGTGEQSWDDEWD